MKKGFNIFVFIFFANSLLAQVGLQVEKTNFSQKNIDKVEAIKKGSTVFFQKQNNANLPLDLKNYFLSNPSNNNSSTGFSHRNFMKTELAFFCKIEVGIEKSTNLPVRFRLGEVQAVDKKEGKWKQFNR